MATYPLKIKGTNSNVMVTDGALHVKLSNGAYPEVSVFASLGTASDYTGDVYVVLQGSGIWPVNRKAPGLYYSDGSNWNYLSSFPLQQNDSNFAVYNNVDNSKLIKLDASNVASGTTRTWTSQNTSGTVAYLSDVGGGAVSSVNGQTGAVVLDQGDVLGNSTYAQYTVTEQSKLSGIETGADVNLVDSVNGNTGAVVLNQDDVLDGVNYVQYSTAEQSKLSGIETGAQVNVVDSVNGETGDLFVDNLYTKNGTLAVDVTGGNVEVLYPLTAGTLSANLQEEYLFVGDTGGRLKQDSVGEFYVDRAVIDFGPNYDSANNGSWGIYNESSSWVHDGDFTLKLTAASSSARGTLYYSGMIDDLHFYSGFRINDPVVIPRYKVRYIGGGLDYGYICDFQYGTAVGNVQFKKLSSAGTSTIGTASIPIATGIDYYVEIEAIGSTFGVQLSQTSHDFGVNILTLSDTAFTSGGCESELDANGNDAPPAEPDIARLVGSQVIKIPLRYDI